MFCVAFEVVEIVAEMVVSLSTAALSQIVGPSGPLDNCSAHDGREGNARRCFKRIAVFVWSEENR